MSRTSRIALGMAGIVLIAYADRSLSDAIPLGLLYLLPVTLISTALRRWQIPLLGIICACIAEYADSYPWSVRQGVPRDSLYFFAYTAAGLYVYEVLSRRQSERLQTLDLEVEIEARRRVEEQLRLVVTNSSIAIVTADEAGLILQANDAAERLFAGEMTASGQSVKGQQLDAFLPSLARVRIGGSGWEHLRTMMQCQGVRTDQEPFLADVWMSSYGTSSGGRLTAMIVDSSTDVREREEASLQQVLVGSKLAIGAMSHEIRNICAAISVVQQNLRALEPHGHGQEDFEALSQLVRALERIASIELSMVKRHQTRLNLGAFLRELRIIFASSLRELNIHLDWQVQSDLPEVWADSQSLLQVFLNLLRNSETALSEVQDPWLSVETCVTRDMLVVRVCDNGPGVKQPKHLFSPFGAGSTVSGLGLYLSRAMMRGYHGELHYDASGPGAVFLVQLEIAKVNV
ncbi:PAS domain-containing protein [Granulicella sp. 5B5]|uniref:ATP-binding protein n=1 Tax=Granulicella sp. 5B5 TaxID=1617967 RepID=UPI0015F49ABA|nr:ATP-binding protein [Granulicella sp. 5B5]QMV19479.1 PAS domain-containing protein [Granulicella sp. 5B5]